MLALERPVPRIPSRAQIVPRALAVLLAGVVVIAVGLASAGRLAPAALPAILTAVLHATLLAAALGAAAAGGGAEPAARAVGVTIILIAIASAGARVDERGEVLYLLVAGWLVWLGVQGRLSSIGVRTTSKRSILVGALAGAALGSHVLLSAALTLGYRLRGDGLTAWLLTLAYDAGLNVPSAELFIRGVVFDRLQRRVSFMAGAAAATVAYLARFLPDPRLPATVEVLAGATLYLALLSFVNSWLFWWSGSVVPALASALAFFAFYRLLGV